MGGLSSRLAINDLLDAFIDMISSQNFLMANSNQEAIATHINNINCTANETMICIQYNIVPRHSMLENNAWHERFSNFWHWEFYSQ